MWDPLPIILCSSLVRSNWFAARQMLTFAASQAGLVGAGNCAGGSIEERPWIRL